MRLLLSILAMGALSCLCSLQSAWSQALQGRVLDAQTGEALIGAVVFDVTGIANGAVTDAQGEFALRIATSPDSAFCITASYLGYQRQTVWVHPPFLSPVDILLLPAAGELPGITITGQRLIAEAFRVQKIEKLDIYTNPIAKADALLVVNMLPAATTNDESAAISLRGSSPAATAIFFNEVPIYDAGRFAQLDGIGTFSIFNTNIIDNVQVFPSNPPLEFGNTGAGLIAIQTDDYVPDQAISSITLSMAGIGGQTSRPLGEQSSLTLFGSYQPSLLLKATNPRALRQLPYFSSADAGGYWYHRPDSLTAIKVFNYSIVEAYQFLSAHPSGDIIYEQKRKRNFTVANYRRLLGKGALGMNAGLNLDRLQFTGGNLDWLNRQRDYYFAANYQRYGPRWSYKFGVSADHRQSRGSGQFPMFSYALAAHHPALAFSGTLRAPVYEAYSFFRTALGQRWELGAGLRRNLPSLTERDYWSGQINAQWLFAPQHRLIIAAGNYHRLNLPGSGSNGGWLDSRQIAIDWQWRNQTWEINAALFRKWEDAAGQLAHIKGAEWFGAYRLPGNLQATLSLTMIDAAIQTDTEIFPSEFDMGYFVKAGLDYRFGQSWNFGLSLLWRQGTFFQPVTGSRFDEELDVFEPFFAALSQQERLPDYAIVNWNISRILSLGERANVIVFFNCNNLFDRRNASGIAHNHDYSRWEYQLFSQRLFFVGAVLNFLR
jgi:hypothetical protein